MATAIPRPQKYKVMLNCPIWTLCGTLSSHLGRGYNGRIEINVMNRRLCAFDDETYQQNLFFITPAVQDIVLHGDGVQIRFNPVRSANNNFRMGKMTMSYRRWLFYILCFNGRLQHYNGYYVCVVDGFEYTDYVGLDWIGLDWIGLYCIGSYLLWLHQIRLYQIGSDIVKVTKTIKEYNNYEIEYNK